MVILDSFNNVLVPLGQPEMILVIASDPQAVEMFGGLGSGVPGLGFGGEGLGFRFFRLVLLNGLELRVQENPKPQTLRVLKQLQDVGSLRRV